MALIKPAVDVGGVLQINGPYQRVLERKVDGVNFTEITDSDIFAPGGSGNSVVNLFNGSRLLGPGFFGIHAGGYPITGAAELPTSCSIRTHDWSTHGTNPEKHLWWNHIQPTASTWYWDMADAFVDACMLAGKEILWTLGPQTPTWASARPTEASAYGPKGMAAEPADINTWADYCTALATRFKGKIKYYEIWNEFNAGGTKPFYSGTPAAMAAMVIAAANAIRAVDPLAKIVGPCVTSIGTGANGGSVITGSLQPVYNTDNPSGGKVADLIDIVGVHLYPGYGAVSNFKNIPLMVQRVKEGMGSLITGKPIWDTECGLLTVPVRDNVNGHRHMWRRILATAAAGVDRIYFYDSFWGHGAFTLDQNGRTYIEYERFVKILSEKPLENVNFINNEFMAVTIGGTNYLV